MLWKQIVTETREDIPLGPFTRSTVITQCNVHVDLLCATFIKGREKASIVPCNQLDIHIRECWWVVKSG